MTRTTICLHESILRETKKLAHARHKTIGETITELLSIGLRNISRESRVSKASFVLPSFNMGNPKTALEDKEAISALLEKK